MIIDHFIMIFNSVPLANSPTCITLAILIIELFGDYKNHQKLMNTILNYNNDQLIKNIVTDVLVIVFYH